MMIRPFLPFALFAACATDASDSTDTVTGPQDLSGYATLEDLAVLQEQADQQAEELDELRALVEPAEVSGVCPGATGEARVDFDAPVRVLGVWACRPDDIDASTEVTICVTPSWSTTEPAYPDAMGYTFRLSMTCPYDSDATDSEYTIRYVATP